MQKGKEKCNSNLTVTRITNVRNSMVQKLFQSLSTSVAEEIIISWLVPYRPYNRSGSKSKKDESRVRKKVQRQLLEDK